MSMNRFGVIDFETTGFGKTDRIIEIGLVLVDEHEIVDEWQTLVNPERDISNSQIHGITADIVSLAPIFIEVIDFLAHALNGRILVSHNLNFDQRMLMQEFKRVGFSADFGKGFCTLQATKRRLIDACADYGIEHDLRHQAIIDARSTAQLLKHVVREDSSLNPFMSQVQEVSKIPRIFVRDIDANNSLDMQNKQTIINRINLSEMDGLELSYLDALNHVLGDMKISKQEKLFLNELAESLGLSIDEQHKIHAHLVQNLRESALRDNFLSPREMDFLSSLSEELGIELDLKSNSTNKIQNLEVGPEVRVCFTGKALDENGNEISREMLEELASRNGLIPVNSVTKKSCDLLVAQDVSSMSGKAKKARDFGISVMSVRDFFDLFRLD
jgi:DNA polymerase-3 subunit epsilon